MASKKKTSLNAPKGANESAIEQRLKKSVGAIHSSGNLTLVQRKLANVLLYAAYDDLLAKDTHSIPVPLMCSMLGWEASNNIELLKESLRALQKTLVEFNLREEGSEEWESTSMLSYAHIKGGVCTWRYDKALAQKLYDPAMFAMINLKVQRHLDTAYALNLYENLYRFRHTNQGSTGEWSLDFFREIIGATADYYNEYSELNRKIIKPSLEKINRDTDIVATVEVVKKSRQVVGVKFFVREKTDEEKASMPMTLPGTSAKEGIDAFAEVRNTKAFKELTKHGIAERLSFAWIQEFGEARVIELVEYTEAQDAKGVIKTNSRTYLTSLVEKKAEVGPSEYDKEKIKAKTVEAQATRSEAQKARLEELEREYRTEVLRNAKKALTLDEREAHAKAWLVTPEGQGREGGYDASKGRFKEPAANIRFDQVYLSQVLAKPFDKAHFIAWVRDTKALDPVKLGLED